MGSKPKAGAPSAEQQELLRMQVSEKKELKRQVEQRGEAMRRGRLGRRSLLSGGAKGVVDGENRYMKPNIAEEDLARTPEVKEKPARNAWNSVLNRSEETGSTPTKTPEAKKPKRFMRSLLDARAV